jgi:hypothetical protein
VKSLSLEDLAGKIEALTGELADVIRLLNERPAKVYARDLEPVAVGAVEAARMLSVRREKVYQLHHEGTLNGFRPTPNSDLRFLVSEIREVARQMSEERRGA